MNNSDWLALYKRLPSPLTDRVVKNHFALLGVIVDNMSWADLYANPELYPHLNRTDRIADTRLHRQIQHSVGIQDGLSRFQTIEEFADECVYLGREGLSDQAKRMLTATMKYSDIVKYPWIPWDRKSMLYNKTIPLDLLLDLVMEYQVEQLPIAYDCVNLAILHEHMDLPWGITVNDYPNITLEFALAHSQYQWSTKMLYGLSAEYLLDLYRSEEKQELAARFALSKPNIVQMLSTVVNEKVLLENRDIPFDEDAYVYSPNLEMHRLMRLMPLDLLNHIIKRSIGEISLASHKSLRLAQLYIKKRDYFTCGAYRQKLAKRVTMIVEEELMADIYQRVA